jgi:hypothetical protein
LVPHLHPVLCAVPVFRQVLLHVLLVQQVDGKLSGRPASFWTCEDALLQQQQQQQ